MNYFNNTQKGNTIMSDAFTDIARDEQRARNYNEYIESLFGYITGTITKEELVIQAQKVDSVPRGFWNGGTNLASEKNIARAQKLRDQDNQTWISFLATMESEAQKKFQDVSPLAGKLILFARHEGDSDYRVKSSGLKTFLESKTPEARMRGWSRLDYFLILDVVALENSEVQVLE